MVRVLALVPYPLDRVPGQRFRIEQWAARLRRDGVEVAFSPFLRQDAMEVLYSRGHTWTKVRGTLLGYKRRLGEALRRASCDVLFVYREAALLGPALIEAILARRRPVVFDFDDAIFLPSTAQANPLAAWLKPAHKTARICRLARHVTVGNPFLERFARRHARAVTVIPTTIETDCYLPRERRPNPRPVVGWSGSVTTLPYLCALAPALRELRRRRDFELRVVGGEARIEGVDVRCVPWRAATEVEDLLPFDVGLMPLPDDDWSRGKCGLKALQYMALEVPPVVSPVGVNAAIVRDGVDGFHAASDREWVERLELLLGDPGLRTRLGAAARETVERGYSARVQAPRMAEVLRGAAERDHAR